MNQIATKQVQTAKGPVWVALSNFADKDRVKAAGFRWDPNQRYWWTNNPEALRKLNDAAAMPGLLEEMTRKQEARQTAINESAAASVSDDVHLPCPEGLQYLPYQKAGIVAGLNRQHVLFGDEMGLGKTVQAIGIINYELSQGKTPQVVVICPASLRLNWQKELLRWLVKPLSISVVEGSNRQEADITIINYDVLGRHLEFLRGRVWDVLIVDEAHYLKNPDAARTQYVLGCPAKPKMNKPEVPGLKASRKLFLTGTPIPNRPIEAQGIFHALKPDMYLFQFMPYAKEFCAAHQIEVRTSRGRQMVWDFSGASNLPKLQSLLRQHIMIRRLKADVLKELPAKVRQVVELPQNGAAAVVKSENELEAKHAAVKAQLLAEIQAAGPDQYEEAVALLQEAERTAFTEMSQKRYEVALAKVPYVVEHLENATGSGEKVIVFAHHTDVIDAIIERMPEGTVVRVDGRDSMRNRDEAVTRFQTDPTVRVFVGQIQAAGVGLTLTASSHVVFAELDWVPGNVTQAEDRAHRIGQVNSVLVQHLVFDGSLDARMAHKLVAKQRVADQALNINHLPKPTDSPVRQPVEGRTNPVASPANTFPTLDPGDCEAVLSGIQMLAGCCDGARTEDQQGFNKFDSAFGKKLAGFDTLTGKMAFYGARLVNKYRGQLGGITASQVVAANRIMDAVKAAGGVK